MRPQARADRPAHGHGRTGARRLRSGRGLRPQDHEAGPEPVRRRPRLHGRAARGRRGLPPRRDHRPGRYRDGVLRGRRDVLPAGPAGACGGRTAQPREVVALSGGDAAPHDRHGLRLLLRADAGRRGQPGCRGRRGRPDLRDRQHRRGRASADAGPPARSGGPARHRPAGVAGAGWCSSRPHRRESFGDRSKASSVRSPRSPTALPTSRSCTQCIRIRACGSPLCAFSVDDHGSTFWIRCRTGIFSPCSTTPASS